MSKRGLLLQIFFCFFMINPCYGLDWKKLHERADKTDLPAALFSVQQDNGSIDNLYVLGLVYLSRHKDKEAGEVFNKITALSPGVIEAKWGLAEVLRRQHKNEESEKLLNEVINSSPEFSPVYISLGYLKYRQMDFNQAVRLAGKVLEQGETRVDQTNHVRVHLLRAGAKGMIAHYGGVFSKFINGTAVLPDLKAAEKAQPDNALVKFGLGSFYMLAPAFAGKDMKKAEEYLKKAVTNDPLFADSYVRLGQLYKIKGDDAKYKEYLGKALKIDPGNDLALDISSGRCRFICVTN